MRVKRILDSANLRANKFDLTVGFNGLKENESFYGIRLLCLLIIIEHV